MNLPGWLWNVTYPIDRFVRKYTPRVFVWWGWRAWNKARRVERWVSRIRVLLWKAAIRKREVSR